VLHHPARDMALGLGTAALAFIVSLLVTAGVSVCTEPRPEAELAGLTIRSAATEQAKGAWWKRPDTIAAAVILLAAIAVNLIFL
jgi:SSS family solute:Na+ symporter